MIVSLVNGEVIRSAMAKVGAKVPTRGRTASKEVRRQQLIESTIDSIARRGLAETTLANVADGAGLSHGIVNFHFKSKEALFIETLRVLGEEYRAVWTRALERAGPEPAARLAALMNTDFDPKVCTRKKISVWYAFYGEAKSRPTYREICGERDRECSDVLTAACRDLIVEGGYDDADPKLVARSLWALTDGLWLNLMMTPGAFDRAGAKQACDAYLAAIFPRHFAALRRPAA